MYTFDTTDIACSATQLALGSSSIRFNQYRTSPSDPQVISPLLKI